EAYKYYCLEITRIKGILRKELVCYYEGMALLPRLKEELVQKASEVELSLNESDKQWSEAVDSHNVWKEKERKQAEFAKWMNTLDVTEEKLLVFYQEYQLSKTRIEKRRVLKDKIDVQNEVQMPKDLNGAGILVQLTDLVRLYETDIKFKRRLLSLNNISETGSLARWALEYDGTINKVQEGVIRRFHNRNYKVLEPQDTTLVYLPNPLSVLEGLEEVEVSDEGYWLELNGIYEFIVTDFDPIFDKNKEEIRAYIDDQSVSLQSELVSLEKLRNNTLKLKAIFESFQDPDSYAEAW